jgi:hypothetical protein
LQKQIRDQCVANFQEVPIASVDYAL